MRRKAEAEGRKLQTLRLAGQILREDADRAFVGSRGPVDSAADVASPALSPFAFSVHFRPQPNAPT